MAKTLEDAADVFLSFFSAEPVGFLAHYISIGINWVVTVLTFVPELLSSLLFGY